MTIPLAPVDRDDLSSAFNSPHRVLSGGTNDESDMTELATQAEILSLPALERSDTEDEAEDSHSEEHVMSWAKESMSDPSSNVGSNEKGIIIDASKTEVESSLADDEETDLERPGAPSRPIIRQPPSLDPEGATYDQKIVFKMLQTASYKE